MVRISDIADALDVSRSLVSKVLSGRMGRSSVRPELAERIHAQAREMGYVPNATARALFTGRQNVVGVFISHHGQPGSGLVEAFLDGVSSEFAKTHQRMLLQFFHDEPDFEGCLSVANRNVVDGVIVAGAPYFDLAPKLNEILRRKVPVATMFSRSVAARIPNAGVNQMEVGLFATRHLVERGCRRPLFIKAPHKDGRMRFEGYQAALKEAGLPFRAELVCARKTYETAHLTEKMEAVLKSGVKFDGVVAESDRQSATMLRMLSDAGLRVPEEVKVIGVDNSPVCEFSTVRLSSVSGQDRRRAVMAVRLLNALIEGGGAKELVLSPMVVARESTVCNGNVRQ